MTFSKGRHIAGAFAAALYFAAGTVAVQAQAGGRLQVMGAQQSNAARLVFDVPEAVPYKVEKRGPVLQVSFDGVFTGDLTAFAGQTFRQFSSPRVSVVSGRTTFSFSVPSDAVPRDFRSGQYLIVDIYSDSIAPVIARPVQQAPATAADGDDPTQGDPGAEPGTETSDAGEAADAAAADGQPLTENVGVMAGAENDVHVEPEAEPLTKKYEVRDRNGPLTPDSALVGVTAAAIDDGVSLSFPWPEEVAAAAFIRGGFLWLVFDQPYRLDAKGFYDGEELLKSRIRYVDVQKNSDALVLRIALVKDQSASMERRDNLWILNIKDTRAKPRFPMSPTRGGNGQGLQIHISATDLGRKIEVEDPAVGDLFVVVPMLREGRGLAQTYSYATAELAETAQGIVVVPMSDLVDIERYHEGVTIRATGNDVLSATRLPRATDDDGVNRRGSFARLVDFKSWRMGEPWEYRKNKGLLFYELSLRPANDRNEVRWKLARFYLAHGRGAETLGMLERMLNEEPLLIQNSEYLAVRGVANFKQGRYEAAAADLGAPELAAEQDAELWQAMTAEAMGHYKEALDFYRRGKDVMGTYDNDDKVELQLAVIRAAIATEDYELAQRELELLNGLELSEAQVNEMVYQSARIAEHQGQLQAALLQYDDLSAVPQRSIAARARFSRIKYGLANGDLNAVDAIDQLERLRFAWRGDRFEIQLIDDLAELYFQTGQFENGLELLRQGIAHFPDLASDRRMTLRMGNVFRSLFEGGAADKMAPIDAISLFYRFRELTPLGADGDQMIRRLADRLVSVDLLDRAAELLEYQVRVRTEGAARALIAANLAKIYLLNEEPEKAQEIIRATREPRLPEDIDDMRRWVEARALIELKRFEEAEVMLENDSSKEADVLRADIYWGSKNWTNLAVAIREMLGDGWRREEPITDLQRLNLVRLTVALTFLEDRGGLVELRRRYGRQMREGDFSQAFDLLTNDQELSGRELGKIATQIASVEKLQSYMRDYRNDFAGK